MNNLIFYDNKNLLDSSLLPELNRSKTIVLAHGVFDFLHPGHVSHLEEASTFGDQLIVSITADRFVEKGVGRPLFNQSERATMLNALSCVDTVIINSFVHAVNIINYLKPDIYVKGVDYNISEQAFSSNLKLEVKALKLNEGEFRTTITDKESTSDYIQELKERILKTHQ